jgi:signal transduction histidine kinase/ActR/RegA family two-component response regulator
MDDPPDRPEQVCMKSDAIVAPVSASPTLAEALLQLLARQGQRAPIPVLLCALLLASVASSQLKSWLPWGWFALVALVLAISWRILRKLPDAPSSADDKLRIVVALSALNGLAQASSLAFAVYLDAPGRAIQSIVLLGLCAGAVATSGGYRPAFVAFAATTLLPLSALWATGSGDRMHWMDVSTAVMILVYGLVLLVLAKDAFQLFKRSFEIRQEQVETNRQLREALREAEAANRAKTRFLASASHDLRQPMHTLSLFSAALTMRPLDPASKQVAEHISTALQALGAQLDALLDVSKLDAGVVPVRRTSFPLSDFLGRFRDEYLPLATSRGLALTLRCPPDAICETDEALFGRILRNLLENAIKYTPSGSIGIEARLEGPKWQVSVQDTGIGIPPGEQQRVFEEFYQLGNPERDRSRGLGLGLSIVRRLCRLLAVDIAMASSPGAGTTFTLSVPRGQVSTAPGVAEGRAPDGERLDGMTILVLDDEAQVRLGMQALLQALGCRVELAGSIAEALDCCEVVTPDLAVVDLRLRGDEDGIAAVEQLRRALPGLPAIFVSGDTAPDRLKEAHAAGVPLLHKPVAAATLCDAIAAQVKPADRQGADRQGIQPRRATA